MTSDIYRPTDQVSTNCNNSRYVITMARSDRGHRRVWKSCASFTSSLSSSRREDSWGPLRRLFMMTVILCLLPLPSDTQWWSIANLHDPRVTRTSRNSPPDSVGLVSGLDSNNLLQDHLHSLVQFQYKPAASYNWPRSDRRLCACTLFCTTLWALLSVTESLMQTENKRPKQGLVTSSDGSLRCMWTNRVPGKPGQKRCQKSKRTVRKKVALNW